MKQQVLPWWGLEAKGARPLRTHYFNQDFLVGLGL
jgi:hypothetical protein